MGDRLSADGSSSLLTDWLAAASSEQGVFRLVKGGWEFTPYAEFARRTAAVRWHLNSLGVERDDGVLVAAEAADGFPEAFFGALTQGASVSVVPARGAVSNADDFATVFATRSNELGARFVLCGPSELEAVTEATRGLRHPPAILAINDIACGEREAEMRPLADCPIVQFTSGSSGQPKRIALSQRNIEHNVRFLHQWLGWGPHDAGATWLPVHHDMGLIGCFLTTFTIGSTSYAMSPRQFIRSPLSWLEIYGWKGGVLGASPPFGLEHILRRVRPADLEGSNFESWRGLIIGSERIDLSLLRKFVDLLEPHGFNPCALLPAYGLAEATLIVTASSLRVPPQSCAPGGELVPITAPSAAVEDPISCGEPIADTRVWIVDVDGDPVAEGELGEIVVAGPSVSAAGDTDEPGVLATGDVGFVAHGELVVMGRMGDSVKVRGVTVFAVDVEAQFSAALSGVPPRSFAVVLTEAADQVVLNVFVETRHLPAFTDAVVELARTTIGTSCRVAVFEVSRIPRTSSGKVRRRALWEARSALE